MKPTLFVARATLDTGDPVDATNGLVQTLAALREQLWTDAEIPDRSWQIYFADFYVVQVLNGGHSQFFYNAATMGRARVTRGALAGLALVGATAERAALEAAVAIVTVDPSLVERLDDEAYWGAADEVSEAFDAPDQTVWSRTDSETGWWERCREWLRTSPEVERLDDDALRARLESLAAAVPDREARARAAEDARLARMPTWQRRIREACRARGLGEPELGAGRPLPDGGVEWTFFAGGTRSKVVVGADGSTGEIEWALPEDPRVGRAKALVAEMLAKRGR